MFVNSNYAKRKKIPIERSFLVSSSHESFEIALVSKHHLPKGVDNDELYGPIYEAPHGYTIRSLPIFKTTKRKKKSDSDGKRECLLAVGVSGCGKTYFATEYAGIYRYLLKNNKIVLISPINDNKVLEQLVDHTINVNDPEKAEINFLDPETNLKVGDKELTNSLVIIDDIENTNSKELQNAIVDFAKKICKTGRHFNISLLYLQHSSRFGKNIDLIEESNSIVIFPESGTNYGRILHTYLEISNKAILAIKNIQSRYVLISNTAPKIIQWEDKVMLLNEFEKLANQSTKVKNARSRKYSSSEEYSSD